MLDGNYLVDHVGTEVMQSNRKVLGPGSGFMIGGDLNATLIVLKCSTCDFWGWVIDVEPILSHWTAYSPLTVVLCGLLPLESHNENWISLLLYTVPVGRLTELVSSTILTREGKTLKDKCFMSRHNELLHFALLDSIYCLLTVVLCGLSNWIVALYFCALSWWPVGRTPCLLQLGT